MTDSLLHAYEQALSQRTLLPDPAQKQAAHILENTLLALNQGQATQGVYLWGPVGRGKTYLMDLFFKHLCVPATRQHFHVFMRFVHQRLFQLTGTANPLNLLAKELAHEVHVLCFDELYISDIGDAMLLGGLFQALFAEGLVLVATSNQPPDQLYPDGYNRERLLPALDALAAHMQVVSVDGGVDHRLHQGERCQRYWVNQPNPLHKAFESYGPALTTSVLNLGTRTLEAIAVSERALLVHFATLCEGPYTALEFIALAERFDALFIAQVPCLSGIQKEGRIARGTEDGAEKVAAGDRVLPALAPHDNAVRRFIALIDECYEKRVPVYLNAAVELDDLYTQGYLADAFKRTLSRLKEMQLARYG